MRNTGKGFAAAPYHPALLPSSSSTAMPGQGLLAQTGAGHLRGVPYRVLAGNSHPDPTPSPLSANAISRRWLVFTQVLRLCQQAGLVKLGPSWLDGAPESERLQAQGHELRPPVPLRRGEEGGGASREAEQKRPRRRPALRERQARRRTAQGLAFREPPEEDPGRPRPLWKKRPAAKPRRSPPAEERCEERKKKEAARGRRFGGRQIPARPGYPQPNSRRTSRPGVCLMKDGATGGYQASRPGRRG